MFNTFVQFYKSNNSNNYDNSDNSDNYDNYDNINKNNNHTNTNFLIILYCCNQTKNIKNLLENINKQKYNNYSLYLVVNNDDYIFITKSNILSKYKLLNIFVDDDDRGKFYSYNKILKSVSKKFEYFILLDHLDHLDLNRLNNDNKFISNSVKYIIINNVLDIFENKINKKMFVSWLINIKLSLITFNSKILDICGYFEPARFGGEYSYLMKLFIENNSKYMCVKKYTEHYDEHYDEQCDKQYTKNIAQIIFTEYLKKKVINNVLSKQVVLLDIRSEFIPQDYLKLYIDVRNIDLETLTIHWETIGKKEKRLGNINNFLLKYPNFDYKLYINSEIKFTNKYEVYGWVYMEYKMNYYKWLKQNKLINNKQNKLIESIIPLDLEKFIYSKQIKFIRFCKCEKVDGEKLALKYNLKIYDNMTDLYENVLFYGCFDQDDYEIITNHNGMNYLLWIGPEFCYTNKILNNILQYKNIVHLIFDNNIIENIENIKTVEFVKIKIDHKDIINNYKNKEQYIQNYCIYLSVGTEPDEKYTKFYYPKVINELKTILPNCKFIYSYELTEISDNKTLEYIFKKCICAILPWKINGLSRDLNIFNKLYIPTYTDKYVKDDEINIKNILNWINISIKTNISKKIWNKIQFDIKLFEFNKNIVNLQIKSNIDNFFELFKDMKNILFICQDYPGYGGAATNCNKIQLKMELMGFNVLGIYINIFENLSTNKILFIRPENIKKELEKINKTFCPDAIILKSSIPINIKKIFDCVKVFLIPGIFTDDLNIEWHNIPDLSTSKFINHNVISQISRCSACFSNSIQTQQILSDKFKINVGLFYSGFIESINTTIIKQIKSYKYNYGVIISNFKRKIKNIPNIIKFLSGKKNIVLIGSNGMDIKTELENLGSKNIQYLGLIDLIPYNEINYVLGSSFYESYSNVSIECVNTNTHYLDLNNIIFNNIDVNILNNFNNIKLNSILFFDMLINIDEILDKFMNLIKIMKITQNLSNICLMIGINSNNFDNNFNIQIQKNIQYELDNLEKQGLKYQFVLMNSYTNNFDWDNTDIDILNKINFKCIYIFNPTIYSIIKKYFDESKLIYVLNNNPENFFLNSFMSNNYHTNILEYDNNRDNQVIIYTRKEKIIENCEKNIYAKLLWFKFFN